MTKPEPASAAGTDGAHWSTVGESTFVAGMRFLCAVHRWFGRGPFLLFLYPVVAYYWATRGLARRASMQYLQRVQAAHGSLGHAPGWRDGVRHFLSFADTILDKTLALSGRYRFDALRFEGREHLQALLARGRGGMFVTAHIGCLEMCQAAANEFGTLRLNVLVHTSHAEKFNRVLGRLDPGRAVRLLHVTEITPATAVMLAERIEQGEFVAIAGDRIPIGSGKTVSARFLGFDAPFPVGGYVLASLLKCPLFLMGCVREGAGHRVVIEPLADSVALPRRQRDEVLAQHAQRYAGRLESLLATAPFEWFNFFPFWDQPGAGPAPSPLPSAHEHHPS
jgi:predicted LPLAT superfamily acyltransferase